MAVDIQIKHSVYEQRRTQRELKAADFKDDLQELENRFAPLAGELDTELAAIDAALLSLQNEAWATYDTAAKRIDALRDAVRADLRGVKFILQTLRLVRRAMRLVMRLSRFMLVRL